MKKQLCLILVAFAAWTAQAQAQQNLYISGHLSTQGPGLELKYSPQPGINLRTGLSMLSLHFNTSYTVRNEPADTEVDVDLANAHLLFDWHPFIASESFSRKLLLTAGAAYFWKDRGEALAKYRGAYVENGIEIPEGEVGELYGTVQWKKFAPYLGIGFENPAPKKRVNVGFAIGTYYMGKPDVEVTGTKFLSDTENDEREFRETVAHYRWLPVVQVNLNVRLHP